MISPDSQPGTCTHLAQRWAYDQLPSWLGHPVGSGQGRLCVPEPGGGRATEVAGRELGDHSGSRDQPIAATTLRQHEKAPCACPTSHPHFLSGLLTPAPTLKRMEGGVKTEGSSISSQPVTQWQEKH